MRVFTVLTMMGVLFVACGQQGTEPAESSAKETRRSESAEDLFTAYERVRSQLANDELVVGESFNSVAEAARATSSVLSGAAKGHLEQLASAAESAADKAPQELDQAREAFGEVSRHLIALLSAEPDLTAGRHVFECPMAKSYPKWVQASDTVSNPYMGPEMATCGVASEWQP